MTIETSQKPPISPPTQELIDLCQAVAQGQSDRWPELETKAKQRQQELTRAWEDFAKGVEELPPDVGEAVKPVVTGVESGFQAYAQALDKILGYGESKKEEQLKEAGTTLAEASPYLLWAQTTYESAVLTHGPSKFPTVNLFENLAHRLLTGKIPTGRWRGACQAHQQFYQQAIQEIDNSSSSKEPGVPERKAALGTIIEILKKIEGYNQATPRKDYEAALQLLTQAHLELEAAVNTFNYHTFAEKPTASPEANRVIYTAHAVREKKMAPEVLKGMAGHMQEHVRKSISDMQAATRLPSDSTVVLEEIPKMIEAMESMDEALETLKNATDPFNDVETAIEQLTTAVDRLSQSHQVVQQQNETIGKTMCPHCQTYNPAGQKNCSKCNRQLPHFAGNELEQSRFQAVEGGGVAGLSAPQDAVVAPSMKGLYDACEAYEKGNMPQEEFLEVLKRNEEKVRVAEVRLSNMKVPEIPVEATEAEREKAQEFNAYVTDAIGLLAQGVGQCMSGLMKLERYAREDQVADMRDGLKEYFDGTQKLVQIERVAKSFVAALPPKEEDGTTNGTPQTVDVGPQDGTTA